MSRKSTFLKLSTGYSQFYDVLIRGFCHNFWTVESKVTTISERCVRFLPEKVAPPLWCINYFRESRTYPTVCLAWKACIWRLKSTIPSTAVDGEAILDDMVLPLWGQYGRITYSVEISWLFSGVPAHYIVIILSP